MSDQNTAKTRYLSVLALLVLLSLIACGNPAPGTTTAQFVGITPTGVATPIPTIPPTVVPTAIPTASTIASVTTRPASPATPATPTSAPTARVETRQVRAVKGSDRLDIIGEVVNTGEFDVKLSKATGSLLNDAGQVIATGTSVSTGVTLLLPGQHTIFQLPVGAKVDSWKAVRVEFTAPPATANDRSTLVSGVKVEKLAPPTVVGTPPSAHLTGQFLNTSTERAAAPSISVAGYDAAGVLTHFGRASTDLTWLAAGASAPFTVNFYVGPTTVPARYEYWSYASKMTTTVAASPLTAAVAGKTDTGGGAYFGTVRNTGQSDLATIQLSVTLHDETGNVVGGSRYLSFGADLLAPGAETIWHASMGSILRPVKDVKVQAHAIPPSDLDKRRAYTALVVTDTTFTPTGSAQAPRVVAAGRVGNNGDGTAYLITLLLAIYDADGTLILVKPGAVQAAEIAPGAEGTFNFIIEGIATAPSKYAILVKASRKN